MADPVRFDPRWEEKYEAGHNQRYPWDAAVTFVYRNVPAASPRDRIAVLEVGSGTASNLWFAAREGFAVAGLEGSASAVEAAKARFEQEGLAGDLRVGDFTARYPWPDDSFDLGLDRGSLTCTDDRGMNAALAEFRRVLKPGGRALLTPCADTHTSRLSGETLDSGLTVNMRAGTMAGIPGIRFYRRDEIERILANAGLGILSIERLETTNLTDSSLGTHAEFRIVVEKPR